MRRSKTAPPPPESRGNFTPRGVASYAEPSAPRAEPGSSRFAFRNWRVATRLNIILLIPVLVALVFGGFQVRSSVETLNEAQDAELTAELVRAASGYAHALLDERDRTAAPLLNGDEDDPEVAKARKATDDAAAAFDAAAERAPQTASLTRRLDAIGKGEPKLARLRQAAYTDQLKGVETEEGYVEVEQPLLNLSNELGLGTSNITSYGRTVYAISLAKGAESLTRSIGTHLLIDPGPAAADKAAQLTAFQSYAYLENIAQGEYSNAGTQGDVDRLRSDLKELQEQSQDQAAEDQEEADAAGEDFVAPPAMDEMLERIGSGASPTELAKEGITAQSWYQAATGKFDVYWGIEQNLVDNAVTEAQNIASDAKRDAIVNSAIVLAALLVAFIITTIMARSMSYSMNRLRTAAFDVAEQRLPMLVDQLSRTEPGRVDTQVQPIPIDSRDEIGEVARAFDQVHREAVRLAAEQALLRGNINAIFTNLSSRNQGLIERQLDLISELENNEADPDQLESLFKLDHYATRMRRNGENLLVLAGEEPGRRWNQPVPLVDVLRAASSEVESYERIEITGVPASEIHGSVVTDLVHLLAELLENATSFSSPQTKVRVTATRLPDGRVMIEIHDKGIGLTTEDFVDINHKLANPPTVVAAVSQRMGLYVVGRLADRHGIRVQLRPSGEQAGTTSLVMLPQAITHGGGGDEFVEDDFTVSQIVPEQSTPQPSVSPMAPATGQRTAAELGFDDSRYDSVGVPDDPSTLAPVGRSLFREERRAAMEAQQQGAYDPYAPQQPEQQRYEEPAYPEPQHEEHQAYDEPAYQQPQYEEPQRDPAYDRDFHPQPESGPATPVAGREGVGFDRPGPSSGGPHSVTGVGLPRRDTRVQQPEEPQTAQTPQYQSQPEPSAAPQQATSEVSEWRTANDERWHRAEQIRDPKAGGVTASGLPRRVPRANLVDGTAAQTQQGGPQVSRAPEDVRGRLSSLHRGVRRGRGGGQAATENDRPGFGPGSTYDQER